MLGASAVDVPPSSSWVSPSTQSVAPPHPESPAIGSVAHCSHPSTSYPHAAVTPNNTASEKSDICSIPSTSFATTPRQLSSASSEDQPDMTSSSAVPLRRVRLTFRLPAKSAHRLKRIANMQPQTLRRIGVSTLKVGEGANMAIVDPVLPPPTPRVDPPQPTRTEPFDRPDMRPGGPPQPHPGGYPHPHHPGMPQDQPIPPHAMQQRPPPPQMNNNSSPLLVNLLSSQQQARDGVPVQNGPPPTPGVSAAAQRSFSPYQYPPQTPLPGGNPGVDPQMAVMHQQQMAERQRMIMQQQQQQQQAALQQQQQQQQQQQMPGTPMGPPGTPGCVPQQGPPFFNAQQRPVPPNYPQGQAPPGAAQMFNAQQQRMVPQYPGAPQGIPAQMAQPQQFRPMPEVPQPQPESSPPKKKRKPTKKQQQKEAEMAAASAQQQFMNEQQQRMMHTQQHIGSPGISMMGHNFPQAPNYPPQFGYPPGTTPQQQQQIWQMQQHRIMMQQQQHQQQQAAAAAQAQAAAAAAAAAQGQGTPQWHQRPPVPYPPTTPLEAPGSVHPVSQRPSSEFGADGSSPMTPQSFPQQPGMMNGPFMRNDSHGNLFNFNNQAQPQQPAQPTSQQHQQDPSASENPVDKLWTAQDDHLGDLGNLDDIDVQPMEGLPADLLDEASSSSSSGEKAQQAPNTPNGDRIDSSIASVVEMVSKSNAQPPITSVSQAMSTTGFLSQNTFNQQTAFAHMQMQGHPGDQNSRIPQMKPVKLENGTPALTNGHREQVPNGGPRIGSADDDEQIGQYVKSLIVADEQRRKAQDAGSRAKAQRKSRSKKVEVKEELSHNEEDFFDRNRTSGMVHPAAFQQQLARTQLIKQQGPPKQ